MNTSRRFFTACAVLAVLVIARPAGAQEFHSPSGYSLNIPAGWQVATSTQKQALNDVAKAALRNVDLSKVDAYIFDPADPATNMNVVVVPGPAPFGPAGVVEVQRMMPEQLRAMGMSVEAFDCQEVPLGSQKVLRSTWTSNAAALHGTKLWQRNYTLAGKVHAYLVTCTTPVLQASAKEGVFAGAVGSMRLDEGPQVNPGWWSRMPAAFRHGFVSGCIGGVVGAIIVVFKKMNKKA